MTFGDENGHGVADEKVSRELFDAFLEAGGNFFDTANDYTGGKSEAHLGKFISSSTERDRFVIQQNTAANMRPDDPNSGGNSRKSVVHWSRRVSSGCEANTLRCRRSSLFHQPRNQFHLDLCGGRIFLSAPEPALAPPELNPLRG